MQRWADFLAAFNFKIEYIKGELNVADGFPRLPRNVLEFKSPEEDEISYINFVDKGNELKFTVIKNCYIYE